MLAQTTSRHARLSLLSTVIALFASVACSGDYGSGLGPNFSTAGSERTPGAVETECPGLSTNDRSDYCTLGQARPDNRIVDDLGRVIVCTCATNGQF